MLTGVLVMAGLAGLTGGALLLAASRLRQSEDSPADHINALLPQTQCAQCGFPGCRPYAQAIVDGNAGIDQCAPGGDSTVAALATLLGKTPGRVNPDYGQRKPPGIAVVNEADCIGCVLCVEACPVDAIVGAAQFTHTVIRSECTGCELCLPPCPVDCIAIETLGLSPTARQAPQ